MKSVLLFTLLGIISSFTSSVKGLESEKDNIQETIKTFSKAGDERNLAMLDELLDDNYRIVMNQLFGSKEIALMDKATYLSMIEARKFGGDDREVEFKDILISGNNAIVSVNLWGNIMNVASIFNLVKNEKGQWKLISDTPTILK